MTAKANILIVDDEVSFARMVKLNLEKTGFYDVREENRGTLAVPVEVAPGASTGVAPHSAIWSTVVGQ